MNMAVTAVMTAQLRIPHLVNWLFETSVMVSILVGLVLLLKWILKNRLPVKWQYALWLVVLLRALLPWVPESSISIYNLFSVSETSSRIDAWMGEAADRELKSAGEAEPATEGTASSSNADVSGNPAHRTASADTQVESANASSHHHVELTTADITYVVLFGIWLIGALALSTHLIRVNRKFTRSIVNGCSNTTNPELLKLLQSCKDKLGIRRSISLRMTKQGVGPALHGLWSPSILLPTTLVDKFSANEIKYIFIHELVHHKRKDIAVNWAMTIFLIIHWFNPILWYAYRKMREDQELSCDAKTVSYIDPDEARQYGYTLIKLLETLAGKPPGLLAAAYFSKNRREIKRRITMIALFKKSSVKRTALGLIIIAIIVGITLTNAKVEDDDETSSASVSTEADMKDWMGYDDYMTSKKLGLVTHPNIKVEDKGYRFEIENVMVDNSRIVIIAKHFGPDGQFLHSPLEDGGIYIKDPAGNVVASPATSLGGVSPNFEEYVFLFTDTPPDQIIVQGKADHIWATKKDSVVREKVGVKWNFEFTLDMAQAKRLGTSEKLDVSYTTPEGLQMGMKQFFRTPNGLRLDIDLSLNEALTRQVGPDWRRYVTLWYHLETDDPQEKVKYFGDSSRPFEVRQVYDPNSSVVHWSRTWLTKIVSPELQHVRFVLDGYSLPINQEASVKIDLAKLVKQPVVFEDAGDKITLKKQRVETDPDTGTRNLRLSGTALYTNMDHSEDWVALDSKGTEYSVQREGYSHAMENGENFWDEFNFIVKGVPDNISTLTLKRTVVEKKFKNVNWSVDLPSYTTLPWKN